MSDSDAESTRRKYRCPCGGEFDEWDSFGYSRKDVCPFCGTEKRQHDTPNEDLERRIAALETTVQKLFKHSSQMFGKIGQELNSRDF